MNEDSLRYEGWRVAAASGVSVFLSSLTVVTFAIFLKPLSEEFSWSREAVSAAFGVAAVTASLCAAPLGLLLDRFGPKRVVVPCLTLLGLAFASLAALTPRLWHLYAVFGVIGAAGIGTSPMAYARAISSWFDRRRGMALAVAISGAPLGGIIHPPAAQALIQFVGWRGACVALGGLMLAIGLPMAVRFVRERPRSRSNTEPVAGAPVREGLISPVFAMLVVVLFCSAMIQNGTIVHLPALLTDRGISPGRGAIALSSMGAAAVLGRLVTGWLIDRFFAARVSCVMLAVSALGAFLLSDAHSFAAGVLAAMLIGFGVGGESDIIPFLLSRYFGLRSFSTLYGFTWIAVTSAGAIGPVLMARSFDATGSYQGILVNLAFTTLGAATLMLAMPRYDASPPVRS